MYKIYFKQAVEILKQNKFFSIISIAGTALAIMMIMAIVVTDNVKNFNAVPENNRDRTLYLSYSVIRDTMEVGVAFSSGTLSYNIVKEFIPMLETPELVAAHSYANRTSVDSEITEESVTLNRMYTDPTYWKFLSFSFLEGRAFSEEEFLSEISNAVISESAAKKLFKGESAIGKTINVDLKPYRVIGIIKDVSPVFTEAYSDIWIPFTSNSPAGSVVLLLPKNKSDITAIKEEFRKIEKKYSDNNNSDGKTRKSLTLRGPETHRTRVMNLNGDNDSVISENIKIQNRKIWFIVIVILLVPAINLSGLNLSRIKRRTPEIGVRKAFGAKRHVILIQVLCENLITSFIGGILGLLLSVFVLFHMRNWLLGVPPDSAIPFSTIFSIPVFLSVFTACVIINVLSAAIPAYRASRMSIVNSITNNDK